MACGVFISSVKFSGQTCQVTFLDASSNLTYQLGEETIPFTYYPPDNSPQGTYFIYFSGTDTTYPLVVSGSCPTPTPTPTVTHTVTPTVSPGLTPTMTPSVTATLTPTPTETAGYINDLFSTGSTISSSCSSSDFIRLYSNEPFYTPNQDVFTNPGLSIFAPIGYYTNNGIVYSWDGFNFISQGACPTLTPTPTPTSTLVSASPTPTPTPTPTPIPFVPGNFTFNADYIVLTYAFNDGTDLDTRTRVSVPDIGQNTFTDSIGWCCQESWPTSGSPILTWGGDNTGTGFESVLIDLIEFKSQYPGENTILIDANAGWYGTVGTNPVYIQATLYKGGTMVADPDNFTFYNNTYTSAYGAVSSGKTITLDLLTSCVDGEPVKSLQYNLITFAGQFI